MPSRFSISNFKGFTNAGFWALIIILALETLLQAPLRKKFQNHHVDQLALQLDQKDFDAPVLILGDSVAENVFRQINGQEHRYANFASNQAIEMTGQYFFLKRYLQKSPPPGAVVLMAGTPLYGDLEQIFTENYIQRVFTRWSEIGWMAAHTLNPIFTAKCLAYKFSPTFKYRQPLRNFLGKKTSDEAESVQYTAPIPPVRSLSYQLKKAWQRTRGVNASTQAWQQILATTQQQHIPLIFIPPPATQDAQKTITQSLEDIAVYKNEWPHLQIWQSEQVIFPDTYFKDGTHFNPTGYQKIRPYLDALYLRILTAANLQEQQQKSPEHLSVHDLKIRQWLQLPTLMQLQGTYPQESQRAHSFQWCKPQFQITVAPAENLYLETASASPAGQLRILSGSPLQSLDLKGGKQSLIIPLSPGTQTVAFSFPAWQPAPPDTRELGIAIQAVGLRP